MSMMPGFSETGSGVIIRPRGRRREESVDDQGVSSRGGRRRGRLSRMVLETLWMRARGPSRYRSNLRRPRRRHGSAPYTFRPTVPPRQSRRNHTYRL